MNPRYISDQDIRVSDAERQAITDRLAAHYADGRLDQAEFDERAGRAMTAKTRGDLRGLLADLPEPGPAGAPRTGTQGGLLPSRGRRRHPVLLTALLVFAVMITAHAIWWFAVPGLFLGIIFVTILALTGHIGRSRVR